MSLSLLLLIVLVLALVFSGWGFSRYGARGVGPLGVVLIVLGCLYFTGNLNL